MPRVLVTGMSGVGKSTLLDRLAARGALVLDTDHDGWTLADGTWDEPRMTALLDAEPDVVVSGCVANQGRFPFDQVVLLSLPVEVLLERVRTRRTNPYGTGAGEEAEILANLRDVEPLLRQAASMELDGRREVDDLADVVESLVRGEA